MTEEKVEKVEEKPAKVKKAESKPEKPKSNMDIILERRGLK